MPDSEDKVVDNPTFLEHIKFFFEAIDVDHMAPRGVDLATYDGVKANATSIYSQTKSGSMPPEPERRWSQNRVKTFKNWISGGFPMGNAPAKVLKTMSSLAATARGAFRRDAENMSKEEVERLALAFRTIMERSPDHPQSYFALADIHWFPTPVNCLHHEERYNPWHRIFIDRFEAGLQSVPGCEDIKLPYWNVVRQPPAWMFQPPFDSYTLQRDAAPQYPAGTATKRHSAKKIHAEMVDRDVEGTIKGALDSPTFESFTQQIEQAHDDGHVSCGPAMQTPDIAAFDPIFWLFHCNWERMWWAWQQRHQAVSLEDFRKTLSIPDMDWLDVAPFNELKPFTETAAQAIDASQYAYEDPAASLFSALARVARGNISADQSFSIPRKARLSIRVKNIARLAISGSFEVQLLADGKRVARHAFFQGTEPKKCPSCVKRETVNVDLRANRSDVAGKKLEVRIEVLGAKGKDRVLALSEVGNPTINIRELLVAE
ncbi:hypothetical protein X727_28365 [Mesorhizobium sp. L103C119B0]|uniref:tyrosinase family protein n=1 Tax=Mesorhizobium sp. L103C119B0 TaxID=1287085 RepID=UPI0003CF9CFB|nr:tyrosinase family protein [Mesorhizobium sp. L103C119B0]ESZ65339.1 hypothetical protein X727_28365 [Mesorhizobium sp. L103C119B0]